MLQGLQRVRSARGFDAVVADKLHDRPDDEEACDYRHGHRSRERGDVDVCEIIGVREQRRRDRARDRRRDTDVQHRGGKSPGRALCMPVDDARLQEVDDRLRDVGAHEERDAEQKGQQSMRVREIPRAQLAQAGHGE